jgi:hypothetical protein
MRNNPANAIPKSDKREITVRCSIMKAVVAADQKCEPLLKRYTIYIRN